MSTQYLYWENEEKKIVLSDGMVFGRNSKANIVLPDDKISSKHFQIKFRKDFVYIVDLESYNKTFLNGIEINAKEEVLLEAGDRINVGDHILYFNFVMAGKKHVDLPDLSNSMQIEDMMEDLSDMGDNVAVFDGKKSSKEGLGELRKAKQVLTKIKESIIKVKKGIVFRDNLGIELNNLEKEIEFEKSLISKRPFQNISDINKSIGDTESEINKTENEVILVKSKIEELKKHISSLERDIEKNKIYVQNLNDDIDLCKKIEGLSADFEVKRKDYKMLCEEEYEQMLENLKEKFDEEEKTYKDKQANYGAKLYGIRSSIKRKA